MSGFPQSLPPASSSNTVTSLSSERRAARTDPAEPPPTENQMGFLGYKYGINKTKKRYPQAIEVSLEQVYFNMKIQLYPKSRHPPPPPRPTTTDHSDKITSAQIHNFTQNRAPPPPPPPPPQPLNYRPRGLV